MSEPSQPDAPKADDREPGGSPPVGEPKFGVSFSKAVGKGVVDAFTPVGKFVEAVGGQVILAVKALSWLPRPPYRVGNYTDAGDYIGFGSLPIVILVGAFTGMVTALQSIVAFRTFQIEYLAGGTTAVALSTELAPVLTSLMLAGRVGSGIATELGTMRITEQIDALESMAINPIQYLVLPRLVMGTIMAPILVLIFFIVGMAGAYFVGVILEGVDQGQFVTGIKNIIDMTDVFQGLFKGMVFGFVVVLIGCFQGFNATGGGRGVGMGTTRAVVQGSVSVLVLDYFLTEILLAILPAK